MKHNITESQLTTADAKAILQGASELRNKPTLGGKFFKGLQKDKIEISDLQKAWADEGYPDDTRDIAAILKGKFGFEDKEIQKVFSNVFGESDDEDDEPTPAASETMVKMVEYIKKAGLADKVKQFMQSEFGEDLGITQKPGMFDRLKGYFGKKAVAEEVRQIFTSIVNEERTGRFKLLREYEKEQLGRSKK
jgi:hypothetical protein